MQKWPYADFGYINVEHFRFPSKKKDLVQKREYLTVEVVFSVVSENSVMFFDHYAKALKGQRSELDEYLEKLGADSWKLTTFGIYDGKGYQFRQYHFRRTVE